MGPAPRQMEGNVEGPFHVQSEPEASLVVPMRTRQVPICCMRVWCTSESGHM